MSDLCSQIQIGPLALDVDTGRLRHWDGREQALNPQRTTILKRLAQNQGSLVTTDQIIAALYSTKPKGEPDSAESGMRLSLQHIRKALAALGGQVHIVSRYGAGYWLCVTDGAQQ